MLCPVCKAENLEGPNCRRCRADLTLLYALEQHEKWLVAAARAAANDGNWAQGLRWLNAALGNRNRPELQRWRAACLLMLRDHAGALQAYRGAQATPAP